MAKQPTRPPARDDEHGTKGGRYIVDPKTGKRQPAPGKNREESAK